MNMKNYLEPSPGFHEAVQSAIDNLPEKSERRVSPLRVAAITAAALMALSMSIFAGSSIARWSAWSLARPDFTEIPGAETCEDKFGYVPKAVEVFSNGFKFTGGHIVHNVHMAGDGTDALMFDSLSCDYERDGVDVKLFTRPFTDEDGGEIVEIYNGIELRFVSQLLFLVPGDMESEVTEADRETLASGGTDFSFGSFELSDDELGELRSGESEAKFSFIGKGQSLSTAHQKHLSWIDDGVSYSLSALNMENVSRDELILMAKEIIDSPTPD